MKPVPGKKKWTDPMTAAAGVLIMILMLNVHLCCGCETLCGVSQEAPLSCCNSESHQPPVPDACSCNIWPSKPGSYMPTGRIMLHHDRASQPEFTGALEEIAGVPSVSMTRETKNFPTYSLPSPHNGSAWYRESPILLL